MTYQVTTDTQANFFAATRVPNAGELCIETDQPGEPQKLGDGTTPYAKLRYINMPGSPLLPLVTMRGGQLFLGGVPTRIPMVNAYWLGLDDNTTAAGAFPTHAQITASVEGMAAMGARVIRSHTIGLSAGTPLSFETSAGVFVDANLDAADWAVYQARLNGMYVWCPLTDNWNYYHGGKGVFVHWAFLAGTNTTDVAAPTHLFDGNSAEKDSTTERAFFDNTSNGTAIRTLFKAYISAWLNHVNPYTGVANKDEPAIAFIETCNEGYYSAQEATNEWTQDIASYVKGIAPNKLLVDGAGASGTAVSAMKGLTCAAIDVMTAHYYPESSDYSTTQTFEGATTNFPAGSAVAQLAADAIAATGGSKAFVVGEYPWTRSDAAFWYGAIENNVAVDGAAPWAFIATGETHGGAVGSDDVAIYFPIPATTAGALEPALALHLSVLDSAIHGGTS